MGTHRMHITPVALQRIAFIIDRPATREINALYCTQTELRQISIVPVILDPLLKGNRPIRADNIKGAAQKGLGGSDLAFSFGNTDLLM